MSARLVRLTAGAAAAALALTTSTLVAAPATAAESVVVTTATEGAYSETGDWSTARDPGFQGAPARFTRTPGATATWTATAPTTAVYDVDVRYATSVDNATVSYTWTSGPDTPLEVDQSAPGSGWRTIGTAALDEDQELSLTLTAGDGAAVTDPSLGAITRADAVRIVERADGGEPLPDCEAVAPWADAVEADPVTVGDYTLTESGTHARIDGDGWAMDVDRAGFRYALEVDGQTAAEAHPTSGLLLGPARGAVCEATTAVVTGADETGVTFAVTFSDGRTGTVLAAPSATSVNLQVVADDRRESTIRARTAGAMTTAFGLGDLGGFRRSLNVYGTKNLDYYAQHANGTTNQRFVSNFTVFPGERLAQVALSDGRLAIQVDAEATMLGVDGPAMTGMHYFFGDMPTVYGRYAEVREEAGYHDSAPDYELFGVGYESYGALSYNTNQATITDSVTRYLEEGFPLTWAVTGSGFWPYGSGSNQGTTSSFGLWGEKYPDPDAYKEFFAENDISLLLGARQSFRALPSDGGRYDPALDGDGTTVGLERGYFITEDDGSPRVFTPVSFPNTAMYLVDPDNAEAVAWFVERSQEWGVDGYKEDHMFDGTANDYVNSSLVNPINEALDASGGLMMVRNSAFSVGGTLLRLNDTDYNHGGSDRDRTVINGLAYSASGQPNFYPDIVGGRMMPDLETNRSKQLFLTRNAMMAAMSPSMSFGNEPWRMSDPELVAATVKAAQWHATYQPYIYSAAVDSYETGYPSTTTPLPVAFPDDRTLDDLTTYTSKQYQWMLGPSLLVAPLYGSDTDTATSRDVYLPEGEWQDIETGERFTGPTTLVDREQPVGTVPAYVGGTGILVHDVGAADPTDDLEPGAVAASVYPVAPEGATYRYTSADGAEHSTITAEVGAWGSTARAADADAGEIVVRTAAGDVVPHTVDEVTGAVGFPVVAGTDYLVSDAVVPGPTDPEPEPEPSATETGAPEPSPGPSSPGAPDDDPSVEPAPPSAGGHGGDGGDGGDDAASAASGSGTLAMSGWSPTLAVLLGALALGSGVVLLAQRRRQAVAAALSQTGRGARRRTR